MRHLCLAIAISLGAIPLLATTAGAWAIHTQVRGPVTSLTVDDTVSVDLFLDAEPGLQLLSLAVIHDDLLAYDPTASASLPIIHPAPVAPGTTGAMPAYILYAAAPTPTYLVPAFPGPAWPAWPSPPPNKGQVNVAYQEATLTPAAGSGTGIWIGSLVFQVTEAFDVSVIDLAPGPGSPIIIQANGAAVDTSEIVLGQIVLTGHAVPEPATGLLMAFGLAAACLRRRASVPRRRPGPRSRGSAEAPIIRSPIRSPGLCGERPPRPRSRG